MGRLFYLRRLGRRLCLRPRRPRLLDRLLAQYLFEFGRAGGLIVAQGFRGLAGGFSLVLVLAGPFRLVEVNWPTSVLAHAAPQLGLGRSKVVGCWARCRRLGLLRPDLFGGGLDGIAGLGGFLPSLPDLVSRIGGAGRRVISFYAGGGGLHLGQPASRCVNGSTEVINRSLCLAH